MHAVAEVLPENSVVIPVGHEVHTVAPLAAYFPHVHEVQVPPAGPAKPVLHVHCVAAVLLTGDVLPAGHAVHA